MCFRLSILRVSSVKTQPIYCQLKWRHVSTHSHNQANFFFNPVLGTSSKIARFWDPKMFTTARELIYK